MKKIKKDLPVIIVIVVYCIVMTISKIGCPIRFLTGIPCAGCGMSRAILAAIHLNFRKAFYYHPLFITLPFWFLVYLRWEYISKKKQMVILISAIIMFFGTYILRVGMGSEVVHMNLREGYLFRLAQQIAEKIR